MTQDSRSFVRFLKATSRLEARTIRQEADTLKQQMLSALSDNETTMQASFVEVRSFRFWLFLVVCCCFWLFFVVLFFGFFVFLFFVFCFFGVFCFFSFLALFIDLLTDKVQPLSRKRHGRRKRTNWPGWSRSCTRASWRCRRGKKR